MTIGSRLKLIMKDRRITQEVLAKSVGVSQVSISQVLSGKISNPKFLRDIARVLQINLEWLKTGEGDMYIGNQTTKDNSIIANNKTGDNNISPTTNNFYGDSQRKNDGSEVNNLHIASIEKQLNRLEQQLDRLFSQQVEIKEQISQQMNKLIDKVLEK